jgi:peptide/nickel transport system substrate-binding protein
MRTTLRLALLEAPALIVCTALLLTACASSAAVATAAHAGVVTFAEEPATPPDYILPLVSASDYDNANVSDLSELLYRPLYWFGDKGEPVINEPLSLAQLPSFSDNNQVVTVTLKHWIWSNGQPITARDLIFWMNLVSAVTSPNAPSVGTTTQPGPSWAGAVPGGFPENIVSYTQTGTYTVVFRLNASYNPKWYLYNELSQITPLPQASWDELSLNGPIGDQDTQAAARSPLPGTSPTQYAPTDAGTATSGAFGVAQFLNSESEDISTYASDPLWQIVDGPFRLSQFTASGFAKFVPNTQYSGAPKPRIAAFEELPFTTDQAEFTSLESGNLTIGYLPLQDFSQRSRLESSQGYSYAAWDVAGIDQYYYNYSSAKAGAIFKQLYFRQAMQSLVNQPEYIKDFTHGTDLINNGPVPLYPPHNPNVSPLEAKGQVYPYSPIRAVSLLKDHGWTVVPGGTSYCSKPGTGTGECGAGIGQGAKARFRVTYLAGSTLDSDEVAAMKSTMESKAGIDLNLVGESFSLITSDIYDCTASTPCTGWDIANYTLADTWVYFPDYLPTGEELFETGAASNAGGYSNPVDDANIVATNTAPTATAEQAALYKYEDYLARQLPYLEVPNSPYQLTMYKSKLRGVLPQGIFAEIYPEDYYLRS